MHPSRLPISHIQHDHLVQHVTLDLVGQRQVLDDAAREAELIVDTYAPGIDDSGFDYVPSRTIRKTALKDIGVNTKIPDLVLGLGLQGGLPRAIIAVEASRLTSPAGKLKIEKSGCTKAIGRPSPAAPEFVERFEFRDISRLHRAYYSGP